MPRITDQFHSLNDIGWYSSSYLVAMSAVKMLWGKLYTFYPAKWMFLAGLVIFEIGSLVCGIARSSVVLILGRCIAGLGGSSIDSGAIIILTYIVPLSKRAMYMSFLGSVRGITAAAGPPWVLSFLWLETVRVYVNCGLDWEACSPTEFHGDGVSTSISPAVLSHSSVFSSCCRQRQSPLHTIWQRRRNSKKSTQ